STRKSRSTPCAAPKAPRAAATSPDHARPTMPLHQLLGPDRIAVLAAPLDRDQVLDAAARLMAGGAPALEASITGALHQRERMGSTAIGHGVAIPHGRCSTTPEARAAFLRLAHPVAFAAGDGQPV